MLMATGENSAMSILKKVALYLGNMLFSAVIGGIVGSVFGFVVGFCIAPRSTPEDHRRSDEWYVMAQLAYIFWSSLYGAIAGAAVGAFPRLKVLHGSIVGWIIGIVVGYVQWLNLPPLPPPSYEGRIIIHVAFIGTMFGWVCGVIWTILTK